MTDVILPPKLNPEALSSSRLERSHYIADWQSLIRRDLWGAMHD